MNDLERKKHKERADSEGTFGSWQLCVCVHVKKRERTSIVTCLEHETLI